MPRRHASRARSRRSRWGVPVPMDSLAGTNLVLVLADDKGERCTVCHDRFRTEGP